jgi:hypothetical protein
MYEVKGDHGQVNPQIEIVRLAIAINDDLCQAIAYYELFEPSGLSEPLILYCFSPVRAMSGLVAA